MSDEPKKRRGRGRPIKNPLKKTKTLSDSQGLTASHEEEAKQESQNPEIESYYKKHQDFISEGVSQESQLLLRKISASSPYSVNPKNSTLLAQMNIIAQELIMNELEIVALSIYLERFGWGERIIDLEKSLRNTAYAVKLNFSDSINLIQSYFKYKYPGFIEEYDVWHKKYQDLMEINPKDLSGKFKELSKAVPQAGSGKILDYNSSVDDILQFNPHVVLDRPNLDEIMSDPACIELIHAIKSKKKILTRESEELPLALLEEIESVINCISISYKEDTQSNEKIYLANPAALQKLKAFSENQSGD